MPEHENLPPEHLQPMVQLEQHNLALLFANYLLTLGIEARVESTEHEHIVYCQNDKMEQAKKEFESFIQKPFDQN